jgi:glutamine---fructose-6-phosphate transaminase (isomerizing)
MKSWLEKEAREAPTLIAAGLLENHQKIAELARRLSANPPGIILTAARGSSNTAALWLRTFAAIKLGWPHGSLDLSSISVYHSEIRLDNALVVFISQSGASPDLLAVAEHARSQGALSVGLVNDTSSPLASAVEIMLPLNAGLERSVAATKTCLAAFALTSALVEACREGTGADTLMRPDYLTRWSDLDWSGLADFFTDTQSAYIVGRGPGLAVAQEMALKLKEVAGIHAEAMSAAELLHGPIAIASPAMPALLVAAGDAGDSSIKEAAVRLKAVGSRVIAIGVNETADVHLPIISTNDPYLRLMGSLQAFYMALPALAARRGRNPDVPPALMKVTRTT